MFLVIYAPSTDSCHNYHHKDEDAWWGMYAWPDTGEGQNNRNNREENKDKNFL